MANDKPRELTQQALEACSTNAALAAQTVLDQARKAVDGGSTGSGTIHHKVYSQSSTETLSASIGKAVFDRCIDGQPMKLDKSKAR